MTNNGNTYVNHSISFIELKIEEVVHADQLTQPQPGLNTREQDKRIIENVRPAIYTQNIDDRLPVFFLTVDFTI